MRLQTGRRLAIWLGKQQGEELTRRDPLAGGAGRQRFPGAGGGAGVEYTYPEVSQSRIITSSEGRITAGSSANSWKPLPAIKPSMAIYLSVQRIHRVAERLVEGGYPATTPVAVIYKATWPESQTVRGNPRGHRGDKVRDAGSAKRR